MGIAGSPESRFHRRDTPRSQPGRRGLTCGLGRGPRVHPDHQQNQGGRPGLVLDPAPTSCNRGQAPSQGTGGGEGKQEAESGTVGQVRTGNREEEKERRKQKQKEDRHRRKGRKRAGRGRKGGRKNKQDGNGKQRKRAQQKRRARHRPPSLRGARCCGSSSAGWVARSVEPLRGGERRSRRKAPDVPTAPPRSDLSATCTPRETAKSSAG